MTEFIQKNSSNPGQMSLGFGHGGRRRGAGRKRTELVSRRVSIALPSSEWEKIDEEVAVTSRPLSDVVSQRVLRMSNIKAGDTD
ncbi:hypothetical protein [Paenibacillus polymyxa]|uniref:hypothetical protein n=1 Tax=Paenibacillus polymyxa TaxID=1406 RepID=UPI0025B62E59|nr:hypothetical protein [Paenibacillus polymyxa]MDN4090973.1 hypothetical protein [Paenibacillus polymyxa]